MNYLKVRRMKILNLLHFLDGLTNLRLIPPKKRSGRGALEGVVSLVEAWTYSRGSKLTGVTFGIAFWFSL